MSKINVPNVPEWIQNILKKEENKNIKIYRRDGNFCLLLQKEGKIRVYQDKNLNPRTNSDQDVFNHSERSPIVSSTSFRDIYQVFLETPLSQYEEIFFYEEKEYIFTTERTNFSYQDDVRKICLTKKGKMVVVRYSDINDNRMCPFIDNNFGKEEEYIYVNGSPVYQTVTGYGDVLPDHDREEEYEGKINHHGNEYVVEDKENKFVLK